ncbi:MAG: SprB repeat-containing protein [Saprospiraceae bacterium]
MRFVITILTLLTINISGIDGQVVLGNQNHFGGSKWDGVADYFHEGNYMYVISHTYSSDFDGVGNTQPVSYFVFELDSALNLNSKVELVPSVGWSKDLAWVPFGNTCNDDACYFIIQDYALPTSFYLFRYEIPLNGNVSYVPLNDSWDNQVGRMQFLQVKDEFIEVWGRGLDASTRIFRYDINDLSLVDSFTLTNTEFNYNTSWDYSVISNGDTSITLRSNWIQSPSPKIYELKFEKFVGKMSIDSKVLEPGRSISIVSSKQFRDDFYVWGYVHHSDSSGTDYYNADAILMKYDMSFNKISELVLSGSQYDIILDFEIDDSRIVFCGISTSGDGDFVQNDPSKGDIFIGLADTTLKFFEMDYIGGPNLETSGKLDMSKNLSICFQSENSDSSEVVPVTYGDRDVYVATVFFENDCIDSYYVYDTTYVCAGDSIAFNGIFIQSDTTLSAHALGVYCDTLLETGFVFLDPLIVSIDSVSNSSGIDGYIGISLSGGLAPYTYQWSNGVSGSSFISNLSPGLYSVTITDSINCAVIEQIECETTTGMETEFAVGQTQCWLEGGSLIFDSSGGYKDGTLNIYSGFGAPVGEFVMASNRISIGNTTFPSGIYYVQLIGNDGSNRLCKLFIP